MSIFELQSIDPLFISVRTSDYAVQKKNGFRIAGFFPEFFSPLKMKIIDFTDIINNSCIAYYD